MRNWKREYSDEYSRAELPVETRVNFVVYIFVRRMRVHDGRMDNARSYTRSYPNISPQKYIVEQELGYLFFRYRKYREIDGVHVCEETAILDNAKPA